MKNLCRIEVTKASKSAITAVENNGGVVRCVYHSKKGIDQLVADHDLQFRFEPPVYEKEIEYYSNPRNRGYLADMNEFARDFQPRGYIYPGSEIDSKPQSVKVRYSIDNMKELLKLVGMRRKDRSDAFEMENILREQSNPKEKQKVYLQENLKWIEVERMT
jgi:hypothetical protein